MTDRVAIVGSRTLTSAAARTLVFKVVRRLARNDPDVIVISGGAAGIDSFADEAYRQICRRRTVVHRPDWDTHGKRAPLMRNQVIVDDATQLVAIWDGASRGTLDSVRRAFEKGIPVFLWYEPWKKWVSTRGDILALTGPLERERPDPRRKLRGEGAGPAVWGAMHRLRKRLA